MSRKTTKDGLIQDCEREMEAATAKIERAQERVHQAEAEVQAAKAASLASEKVVGGVHLVNLDSQKRTVAAAKALRQANEAYHYAFAEKREAETDLARVKAGQPRVRESAGDREPLYGNGLVMANADMLPPPSPEAREFSEALKASFGGDAPIDNTPSKWRRLLNGVGLRLPPGVRQYGEGGMEAADAAKEKEAKT